MSLDPMLWAIKDAPVANVEERAILTIMGERAHEDGTAAYLSATTLARRALVDRRTVLRRLADMEERRLIARGDQRRVAHLPAGKRPVVYDLLIPYTKFANIDRVNEYRVEHGKPPLTPEMRPDIAPPPPQKRRGDFGVPRQRRSDDDAEEEDIPDEIDESSVRGLQDTSEDSSDSSDLLGGLAVTGDSQSAMRCLQDRVEVSTRHPISSFDSPHDSPLPPTPHDEAAGAAPGAAVGGDVIEEDKKQKGDGPTAEQVVVQICREASVLPARRPRGRTLDALVEQVQARLDAGWDAEYLTDALSGDMSNIGNVRKVIEHRLAELGPPMARAPRPPAPAAYVPGRPVDDAQPITAAERLERDKAMEIIRKATAESVGKYREVRELPLATVRALRAGSGRTSSAAVRQVG